MAVVAGAALLACADADDSLGVAASEIAGGVSDTSDTAVVGIFVDTNNATCTGSLIAPNLVLTARHCVADLPPMLDCMSAFGALQPASALHVTTDANVFTAPPSAFYGVASIEVEPGPGILCGDDIALLVLASNVPAGEAAPIVPRVDAPPEVDEVYDAIGYGATSDFGTDGGERRRRDGLIVDCVGAGCGAAAAANEWVGGEGICGGDSGSPALDAAGRVIGVASRGSVGCSAPVYSDVAAHAGWVQAEAVSAATQGGYPTPPWALGGSTSAGGGGAGGAALGGAGGGGASAGAAGGAENAGGAGGAGEADDGCQCATAPRRSGGVWGVALIAIVHVRLARRRRSRRKHCV